MRDAWGVRRKGGAGRGVVGSVGEDREWRVEMEREGVR